MRKTILSISFCLLAAAQVFSATVVENLNITVNEANPTANITPSFAVASIFTINFFPMPGSMSMAGKVNADFRSRIIADPIPQSNYHPTRIYNNANFSGYKNYQTSPLFFANPNLAFTNRFSGQGNQYIAGNLVFTAGAKDTINFWLLVNLSEDARELKIIKIGYEDEPNLFPKTGTEGMNIPAGLTDLVAPTLQVYPQPAKDILHVEMPGTEILSASLFTLNGALVSETTINTTTIAVAHLPKGIYLLQVNSKEGIATKKIIIGE